jgi:hypothetical protein
LVRRAGPRGRHRRFGCSKAFELFPSLTSPASMQEVDANYVIV